MPVHGMQNYCFPLLDMQICDVLVITSGSLIRELFFFKAKTMATTKTTLESNDLIGWMRKADRAARAARTLIEFFDVVCQMTTWNFQIYGFNDNVNAQQQIIQSLHLILRRFYQSNCSVICQQYRMRPKCKNRKIVTNAQMFVSRRRFLSGSRCGCLIKLPKREF